MHKQHMNLSYHTLTIQEVMQRQNISIGLWKLSKTCQHHKKKVVWIVNQTLNLAKLDVEANSFLPL
jgi:hypothetical protein